MSSVSKKRNMPFRIAKKYYLFLRDEKRHIQRMLLSESSYSKVLTRWFNKATGEDLDLSNPKSFNQKIQWLKLYDSTFEKGYLADKYTVRKWIEEQIGSDYLVPLLGVWDDPENIDFDALPDRFVLKATHGSTWNIIVTDKAKLNRRQTIRKLKHWLHCTYGEWGFELHYRYCEPRIIAEKYLEETTDVSALSNSLIDYKFYTFGGSHSVILVCAERSESGAEKEAYYDENWNKMDIAEGEKDNSFEIERPEMFDEMLSLSHKLATDFPFVRVDWYVVDGKLYFSEMTFTPTAGTKKFRPPEWNEIFGSWIELPDRNNIYS